jgi:hypothetical protein
LECNKLTEITCLATTPPTLHMMAFLQMAQADITLYVPEEAVEIYKATPTWKNFEVKAIAGTGIGEVKEVREVLGEPSDQGRAKEVKDNSWYDMSGRKLDGKPNAKGVFIHGGRKVMIK